MPLPDFSDREQTVAVNGIDMKVYESGNADDRPIVFCHGFPEIAYSWRHQLGWFGANGYHAIAPDLRGAGQTTCPPEVRDFTMANLVRDMLELIDQLGHSKAIFVGHDIGSVLAYALRMVAPDRCEAIVSLNTPMRKREALNPIEHLSSNRGARNYMVAFQKPRVPGRLNADVAEDVLEANVHHTFDSLMKTTSVTDWDAATPTLPPEVQRALEVLPVGIFHGDPVLGDLDFLKPAELDVYVETFTATGFTGGVNWYRNLGENWRRSGAPNPTQYTPGPSPGTERVPVLLIRGLRDPVIRPAYAKAMREIPDLPYKIEDVDCGHWTQQEKPDEVNALIDGWIDGGFPTDHPPAPPAGDSPPPSN